MQISFVCSKGITQKWLVNNKEMFFSPAIKTEADIYFFIDAVKSAIKTNKPLTDIRKTIGLATLCRMIILCGESFHKYLIYQAQLFTERRERITKQRLVFQVYGLDLGQIHWYKDTVSLKEVIFQVVEEHYAHQCQHFISTNKKEMNIKKTKWTLYWMNGPSLNCTNFDFEKIHNDGIRREVMLYFQDRLGNLNSFTDTTLWVIADGFNLITANRTNITCCAEITKTDVRFLINSAQKISETQFGSQMRPSTIRKMIQNCGAVINFLIKHNEKVPTCVPTSNPFGDVTFKNIRKMEKRTTPLPDEVLDQIETHLDELNVVHQRIYKILINTGLRAKEVIYLEENCVLPKENSYMLNYVPYKILKARRKRSLSDYRPLPISLSVVKVIEDQASATEKLRKNNNVPYIFINQNPGHRAYMTQAKGFNRAVNRLIERHNIVDLSGELWGFETRQCRKTVVVDMIENRATSSELSHQLGHLGPKTIREYYEEVRTKRLADLNEAFFKKKFDVHIGEKSLNQYTEEERKVLYVDFCLGNREIEFGYCTKHMSLGPCGKRTGRASCATCSNICTGKPFLHKWVSLRDSQKKIVDCLVEGYVREGITDYHLFREYQREVYLLQSYKDAVDKILDQEEQ